MSQPDLATLKALFLGAPFVAELGMELESLAPGECVASLALEPRHMQQHGVVHAGVQATMADHCAGAAAFTVAAQGCAVVTAEFKLTLLRAARGDRLICRARVLKPGKQLSFAESEVFCIVSGKEQLVAKASVTLAVIAPGRE